MLEAENEGTHGRNTPLLAALDGTASADSCKIVLFAYSRSISKQKKEAGMVLFVKDSTLLFMS